MISALKTRGKRLRCWFGIHTWYMYWSDKWRGYEDRCVYCNKGRTK